MWFFPATAESYGRVLWGYDREFSPFQGGMNDRGLFIDLNALNNATGWKDDPAKRHLDDSIDFIEYILMHCATVDVTRFFAANAAWQRMTITGQYFL